MNSFVNDPDLDNFTIDHLHFYLCLKLWDMLLQQFSFRMIMLGYVFLINMAKVQFIIVITAHLSVPLYI
jgi:hypothetical protein